MVDELRSRSEKSIFIRGKRETLVLNDCGAAEWAGMEGGENAGREAVRFATQHHACTSGMASSPA